MAVQLQFPTFSDHFDQAQPEARCIEPTRQSVTSSLTGDHLAIESTYLADSTSCTLSASQQFLPQRQKQKAVPSVADEPASYDTFSTFSSASVPAFNDPICTIMDGNTKPHLKAITPSDDGTYRGSGSVRCGTMMAPACSSDAKQQGSPWWHTLVAALACGSIKVAQPQQAPKGIIRVSPDGGLEQAAARRRLSAETGERSLRRIQFADEATDRATAEWAASQAGDDTPEYMYRYVSETHSMSATAGAAVCAGAGADRSRRSSGGTGIGADKGMYALTAARDRIHAAWDHHHQTPPPVPPAALSPRPPQQRTKQQQQQQQTAGGRGRKKAKHPVVVWWHRNVLFRNMPVW